MRTTRIAVTPLASILLWSVALAATPPAVVNYQGVLRDQNDKPLSGTYDVTFRFMDAATAGNEILKDQHVASAGSAVIAASGLFSTQLGSGTVTDGSGPGTYSSLDLVFRDFADVWLEVTIGTETLSPRVKIQAAAYALNATNAVKAVNSTQLNGQPASAYLDTSSNYQIKPGPIRFSSSNTSATASVVAVCNGTSMGYEAEGCLDYGGFFTGSGTSGTGVVGNGGYYGVRGYGTVGGYFADAGGQLNVTLGDGPDNVGLKAIGRSYAAYFANGAPDFAYTYVPYGTRGQFTYGNLIGAEFHNFVSSSTVVLANQGNAVEGTGPNLGGKFTSSSTSNYGEVGISSYKIFGNGSVAFVQNHPLDASKVIVYAAPEGDEVAVYTRGSARLVGGEARVPLGETFALVANPDLGLTATATPTDALVPLMVASKSTKEIVVRGPAGSDASFDYAVWALRIGFEEQSIVQPKREESKIPSMGVHQEFFALQPELRGYTARARFERQASLLGSKAIDYSQATALRDAIGVFPYTPEGATTVPELSASVVPHPPRLSGTNAPSQPDSYGTSTTASRGLPPTATIPATSSEAKVSAMPMLRSVDRTREGTDLMTSAGPLEVGEVVSLSPTTPGAVVKSAGVGDTLVIGCVQEAENRGLDQPIDASQVPVATTHIGICRVDSSFGEVNIGDRIAPSPVAGMAMKADPSTPTTIVIGRAIEPISIGSGIIRVLLGLK